MANLNGLNLVSETTDAYANMPGKFMGTNFFRRNFRTFGPIINPFVAEFDYVLASFEIRNCALLALGNASEIYDSIQRSSIASYVISRFNIYGILNYPRFHALSSDKMKNPLYNFNLQKYYSREEGVKQRCH